MNHRSISLLDLPEEVLIKIVRKLDSKTLLYLHSTCSYLRHILGMHGVIKQFNISLSSLATTRSFNLDFFKDIGGHLSKLDVSCVPNLNKPLLLNALIKLKSLKILNISYTSINIMDLFEIQQTCPTINDISMNFDFGSSLRVFIPLNIQEKCQVLFKSFKNIHFVGNFETLFYTNLPITLLQTAKLDKLQFTITDCNLPQYEDSRNFKRMVDFSEITVYLINWKNRYKSVSYFDGFFLTEALDFCKFEYIIIVWLNIIYRAVYVSPLFKEFFKDKFNIQAELLPERPSRRQLLGGNAVFMVWNRKSTVFDETFYTSLFNCLQPYFPHHYESLYGTSALPQNCDWLYITQYQNPNGTSSSPDQEIDHYHQVLDLDSMTAEKEVLKLSIHLQNDDLESFITLPIGGKYMKKLTYIDLSSLLCFSSDIFTIIFSCCTKLETLNVIFDELSISSLDDFTDSLPLSKCIKNVRVVSPMIQITSMLVSLSKCRNLENIQLIDKFSDTQTLSFSRAIFENCANLYNYSIAMEMTPEARFRKLNILNKFKLEYGRDHLNIELYSENKFDQYSYDPYIGVFHICPIKPC